MSIPDYDAMTRSERLRRLYQAYMGIPEERKCALIDGEVDPETDQERELVLLQPYARARQIF